MYFAVLYCMDPHLLLRSSAHSLRDPIGASVNGPAIGPFLRLFSGWVIAKSANSRVHSYVRPALHSAIGPFVDESLIGRFLGESLIRNYIII